MCYFELNGLWSKCLYKIHKNYSESYDRMVEYMYIYMYIHSNSPFIHSPLLGTPILHYKYGKDQLVHQVYCVCVYVLES